MENTSKHINYVVLILNFTVNLVDISKYIILYGDGWLL